MMTEQEFDDMMLAIHEGNATELTRCYLCYLEATGRPDDSPKGDQGPLRGIVRTYTSKGHDPYEVAVLTCGHEVI